MRKRAIILITAAIVSVVTGIMSYGYTERTKSIPNVRLKISTGELEPGDELSDDATSYVACNSNDYYYIEEAVWLDDIGSLKIADQPRMKVYLCAYPKEVTGSYYNDMYLFKGTYNSNNVTITNGTFITADRRDSGYTLEVTLRVKAVKGTYDTPSSCVWSNARGTALWEEGNSDSGYYDVYCYRGSSQVKKLTYFHGNSYNFYPYMTKAGSYTFKVRTVAPESIGSSVGKSSEWLESEELEITEQQVSDGKGQTTADEQGGTSGISGGNTSYPNGTGNESIAGWVLENGYYYFRYPNGEVVKDRWLKLEGKWYLFDSMGHLLYGWQKDPKGNTYFLSRSSGAMKTGWVYDDEKWYYMNTTKDAFEGCLMKGWQTIDGRTYYFNENGVMVTGWYQVGGNWYYFYPQGSGNSYGYMATNTKIGEFRLGADGTWQN